MNVIKRAAVWSAQKLLALSGTGLTLTDQRLFDFAGGGNVSATGHTINEQSAMRVTTAFACVRVLAETVGTVTLKVYEKQSNGNAKEVDHDINALLTVSPNSEQTGMEFREVQTSNLAARGNCYALREDRSSGEALSLIPIPAARCEPKRNRDGRIVYEVDHDGKVTPYPPEKIWHVRGFGFDTLKGLSPIGSARDALGLSMAGEEANSNLFKNGLSTSAILTVEGWLKDQSQRDQAKKNLSEMWTGLRNFGKPILLEGGMKLADGMFSPEEAQFLELRKFQVPEICRLWRISPHMIADLERATNNNIEQLSLEFIMYTMAPYFRRYEERMRQLFKPQDRNRFFVRFNYESLLRADSNARANLYSILLQNGVYSRNEVRQLENRNRSDAEGMDDYTVQSNMALLQMLEQINRGNNRSAQ